MMRKQILIALLCTLVLLPACGKEEPLNWTPSPATPQPTATATADEDALWSSLTVDDLPTTLADPNDLFSEDSPQVYLLGCKLSEELYLYGLNDGYGGGILLRQGESLTHFDQQFASPQSPALPELYLTDTDGDGQAELAVRYLMAAQGDRIAYDLHIYRWTEDTCSDLAVTHEVCAEKALAEVMTDYDYGTGKFTLSYGSTSAVYQVPGQYQSDPGQLILDTCFFREQDGVFTVVLGARLDATDVLFANVLATIDCEEDGFTLRDIRVEPTTVV